MDNVVPTSTDRKQFGQSIGEFQLIQGKVADMYIRLAGCSFALATLVAKNLTCWVTSMCARWHDCASVILWCAEKATPDGGRNLWRQRVYQRVPASRLR